MRSYHRYLLVLEALLATLATTLVLADSSPTPLQVRAHRLQLGHEAYERQPAAGAEGEYVDVADFYWTLREAPTAPQRPGDPFPSRLGLQGLYLVGTNGKTYRVRLWTRPGAEGRAVLVADPARE